MSLTAVASLKVYKLKGDVTKKTKSGKIALQRRTDVKSNDIISIPSGASVDILDTDSHRIYSSTKSGDMTVARLIDDAKKESSSIIRNTNKTLLSAVADNAETKVSGFGATGLSRHQTDGVLSGLTALPDGVSLLSYLMNFPDDKEYDDVADVILMRRAYEDGDDSFNFAVFNTLDTPLHINVIDQKPSDGKIRFYFDENPVVASRKQSLITQYRFLLSDEDTGYIVIASPAPFSLEDVRKLLSPSYSPSQDFYISLLKI